MSAVFTLPDTTNLTDEQILEILAAQRTAMQQLLTSRGIAMPTDLVGATRRTRSSVPDMAGLPEILSFLEPWERAENNIVKHTALRDTATAEYDKAVQNFLAVNTLTEMPTNITALIAEKRQAAKDKIASEVKRREEALAAEATTDATDGTAVATPVVKRGRRSKAQIAADNAAAAAAAAAANVVAPVVAVDAPVTPVAEDTPLDVAAS